MYSEGSPSPPYPRNATPVHQEDPAMKKLIAVLAVAFTVVAAQARDPYDRYGLQLSLFPELQIFDQDVHITGLKLNLIWGYNTAVSGIDLGLFGGAGDMEGIQVNLINYAHGEAVGLRLGVLNLADDTAGIELGLVNYAAVGSENLRIGLVNVARESKGLHIGLINYTEFMHGVQIGLINIISQSKVSFLPIVNAYF